MLGNQTARDIELAKAESKLEKARSSVRVRAGHTMDYEQRTDEFRKQLQAKAAARAKAPFDNTSRNAPKSTGRKKSR